MKHFIMFCLLLTTQGLRAEDSPPTPTPTPTPIPEPNESWEKVQIPDGALTWESKREVAPGRTLYMNVWFLNYFNEALRIAIDDVSALSALQMAQWCQDNMDRLDCHRDSPYFWRNAYKKNDDKFCKLLGKSSSLDFKITDIKKRTDAGYPDHVVITVNLKVYKASFSGKGLLSIVCAD